MDYIGREGEEEMLNMINNGSDCGGSDDGEPDDGSQYLNESGYGIEQTSTDCADGSRDVGPLTKSGEVYILSPVITRCIN